MAHKVEFEDGVAHRMVCTEPLRRICHAVFTCDCVTYSLFKIVDGVPQHCDLSGDTLHYGTLDGDFCHNVEWFDNVGPELLEGKVVFTIEPQFDVDGPDFLIVDAQVVE